MTKNKTVLLAGVGAGFVLIQFFGPARTNPAAVESDAIQKQLQIPARVTDIMNRACMDCHSDETRWPWYSRVAPVSWWLVHHVNEARGKLNLSEWTQYDPPSAISTLGSMATAVERRAMPLASYTLMHPEGRLSDEEIKVLSDWASAERQREVRAMLQGNAKPPGP